MKNLKPSYHTVQWKKAQKIIFYKETLLYIYIYIYILREREIEKLTFKCFNEDLQSLVIDNQGD